MEAKSAAFSVAVPVPNLLDKHNYAEWEIRVRTYLTGQDLWKDIIEDNPENATATPHRQENDHDKDLRRRRNYMALHVIQISCGPDAFSQIRSFRSAKTAWKTLEKKYLVRDTRNNDKDSYLQFGDLYEAVLGGNLTDVKDFIDRQDEAVSKALTDKGETALHIAVTAGHAHIVQLLVDRMFKEDLGTPDIDGYTALMTAVVYGRRGLAECMLQKGTNLISIRDSRGGNLPVVKAIDFGQIDMARYLYRLTKLNDLVPPTSDHNGAKFLTRAIYTRNLALALDLIRRCPRLTLTLDDRKESPFLALASMPHAFPSGNFGAALQMQKEIQWFKEVERIVNPKIKEGTNKDGLTPRQLFTKNHESMMEKREKWMKDTASSCTVVGTLIITIMFAVAFTVPGGNDQTTGFPVFLKKKLFMIFIISDALSLFSSSTSVLMFLGILTSRYAEEDFLEYLPRQIIIGLLTLFCSIATMMIAFSAALLIILHGKLWIAIPLTCLAGIPVTFFIWIQFPILKDMIISTYRPSISDRKNAKIIHVHS